MTFEFLKGPAQSEREQICSHLQGCLPHRFRVLINGLVFPAISKIAFIGVKADQPALVNKAKSLWCFAIVLVYLGQAFAEAVFDPEKWM